MVGQGMLGILGDKCGHFVGNVMWGVYSPSLYNMVSDFYRLVSYK